MKTACPTDRLMVKCTAGGLVSRCSNVFGLAIFSRNAKALTVMETRIFVQLKGGVFTSYARRYGGSEQEARARRLLAGYWRPPRLRAHHPSSVQHRAACRISTSQWRQTTKHATPFAWQCYWKPTFSKDSQLYFENNVPNTPQQLAEFGYLSIFVW